MCANFDPMTVEKALTILNKECELRLSKEWICKLKVFID